MIAVQGSNGVEGTLVDNAELIVSALAKGAAACSRRVTRAGASGARGHFRALVAFRLPAALPPGSSAATARRSTSWQGRTGPETIIVTRAELQRQAMRAVSA